MSEQALIPKIPPIEESTPRVVEEAPPKPPQVTEPKVVEAAVPKVVEAVVPKAVEPNMLDVPEPNVSDVLDPVVPQATEPPVSPTSDPMPDPLESAASARSETMATVHSTTAESATLPAESKGSTSIFQAVTYGSFILTFCLAGFAAIVVFRKISKTLVSRFSIGAKMLSMAFLVIAFNSFLGTYLYSRFLNGESAFFPLIIPILSWLLVGPAIAAVLNALLTRQNVPNPKKVVFDSFAYFVIFGCVAASQIPSLKASEPLVFSSLGALFLIVPLLRFSTSLKVTKAYHPELQEMFVQILIRSLLFLPFLLPALVLVNSCGLTSNELTLLLFNFTTFAFVLMTGLLMIISIDYITQGINADQLVARKSAPPIAPSPSSPKPDTPPTSPITPNKQTDPIVQKTPEVAAKPEPAAPVEPIVQKKPEDAADPEPIESAQPQTPATPATPSASASSEQPVQPADLFEESTEILDFDLDKHDSTVIKFNDPQSYEDESQTFNPEISKPKPTKGKQSSKMPKAPRSPKPDEPKSSDSKARVKPPAKPQKRF